jgi:hypothetical protein
MCCMCRFFRGANGRREVRLMLERGNGKREIEAVCETWEGGLEGYLVWKITRLLQLIRDDEGIDFEEMCEDSLIEDTDDILDINDVTDTDSCDGIFDLDFS